MMKKPPLLALLVLLLLSGCTMIAGLDGYELARSMDNETSSGPIDSSLFEEEDSSAQMFEVSIDSSDLDSKKDAPIEIRQEVRCPVGMVVCPDGYCESIKCPACCNHGG